MTSMPTPDLFRRVPRLQKTVALVVGTAAATVVFHISLRALVRMTPPPVELPPANARTSRTIERAGVTAIHLEGSPEAIGAAHARLLRRAMIADEEQIWSDYSHLVPWSLARIALEDVSLLRYRALDRGLPDPVRRELAAEALAMQPDPLAWHLETYQRLVLLHAVYDIALAFEHSPLVGCTSFALGPSRTRDNHVLAARAFDFEGGDIFDRDKVVLLVRGENAIPYASVAWPGFAGVVTGLNAEGLFAVVHGARAGSPRVKGIPAALGVRQVLERARDVGEAFELLSRQEVMVSHIVFLADARGHFAVVERAPGAAAMLRQQSEAMWVTNEFEGPLASDPENVRVRRETTSSARGKRIASLLASVRPASGTPALALEFLRDHECVDEPTCPLGDRRAIDALIATHGVIADLTQRSLWVSAGPNLSGHFVRFDLLELLGASQELASDGPAATLPDDPILLDGRFTAGHARALREKSPSP
jgi:hypothetical protein